MMRIPALIERSYLRAADALCARWPQRVPAAQALKNARIISHRGEHDNGAVLENTLAAFERARAAGVWGIELDVRWSADGVPVVFHDPDLRRLHHSPAQVGRLTVRELRRLAPAVPTLDEVIERFGRRLHLMIEIKERQWRDAPRQSAMLKDLLSALTPVQDYHFMALDPVVLEPLRGFPTQSYLAIAYHWPDRLSRWVLKRPWGGLCTHYTLLRRSHIRAHHGRGQSLGTAYPCSARCLFRELNRGIDLIFSNQAAELQEILHRRLSTLPKEAS